MNKISVCTVCMNRLFHIRETLPANIEANKHYPNVEFILLDYNSTDGLENWVHSKMNNFIKDGILKYYRTNEPTHFSCCHSKNLVVNLASADIICIIDADNFAGEGYVQWVNSVFEQNGKDTVVTTLQSTYAPYRDQGGKLAFHKECFNKIRGFDESMLGYGVDDVSLANRLEAQGCKRVFIENPEHLKYIGHSNFERVCNQYLMNNLESIYQLKSDNNTCSRILYLLQDNSFLDVEFERKSYEDAKEDVWQIFDGWAIAENGWKKGVYEWHQDGLSLVLNNNSLFYSTTSSQELTSLTHTSELTWEKVSLDASVYINLVMRCSECYNRAMIKKSTEKNATINQLTWGVGTVCLNFDTANAIKTASYATFSNRN